MAFDITKATQDSLTPEEKAWFEGQLQTASDGAVTKFKADTDAARKAAIPENYAFQFSDNSPLDPKTDADKIAAYARKNGLSMDQAAELLKHQEELAGGLVARQKQALAAASEQWAKQTKEDKEMGGDNYNATVAAAKRVIDAFAKKFPNSNLGKLLEESGYGNHPEWVRFVSWIGKAIGEDSPVFGGAPPKGTKKTDSEIVYG